MSGFSGQLAAAEAELWNTILVDTLTKTLEKTPGAPVSSAYSEAWNEFQRVKWILSAEKNRALTPEEYKAMDAGPDLSAVGRVRFGGKGQKKAKSTRASKPSPYNIFVRATLEEHKEAWKDLEQSKKMKAVASIWNQMSEEEKAEYKAKVEQ